MATAVLMNPLAAEVMLRATTVEKRLDWTLDGRACRGTPDAFGGGALVDLKSTKCAKPERFVRDAQWAGYHAQLQYYRTGILESGLPDCGDHFLIAVENKPPHPVVVLELTTQAKSMGERLWRSWFEQCRIAEQSNNYPGYSQSLVSFDVADSELDLIFGDEE